jgi:hypothetical protein
MGGFALCKPAEKSEGPMRVDDKDVEDRWIETLATERFKQLLQESLIEFPTITECEIKDRSKGDAVAKFIAAVQTLWFVLQCIVRQHKGLAITELELTTLALAALNVIVLWFWRDKPLNMSVQVPVYIRERSEGTTVGEEGNGEADTQASINVDPESQRTVNIIMRPDMWLKRIVESEEMRIKGYEELRESLRKERGLANVRIRVSHQLRYSLKFIANINPAQSQ